MFKSAKKLLTLIVNAPVPVAKNYNERLMIIFKGKDNKASS